MLLPRTKVSKKTGERGGVSLTSVVTSPILPQIDRYCPPTKLYGVIPHKTTIVTVSAVRIPNCTTSVNFLCMKPIKPWTIQIINDYTGCPHDTLTNVVKYGFKMELHKVTQFPACVKATHDVYFYLLAFITLTVYFILNYFHLLQQN